MIIELPEPIEFEWDEGNSGKNWEKHQVSTKEAEEAFFDENKQQYPDSQHSNKEPRGIFVGKTLDGRQLFVVYTVRSKKIRVISVRDLNKRKEKDLYEKTFDTSSI